MLSFFDSQYKKKTKLYLQNMSGQCIQLQYDTANQMYLYTNNLIKTAQLKNAWKNWSYFQPFQIPLLKRLCFHSGLCYKHSEKLRNVGKCLEKSMAHEAMIGFNSGNLNAVVFIC